VNGIQVSFADSQTNSFINRVLEKSLPVAVRSCLPKPRAKPIILSWAMRLSIPTLRDLRLNSVDQDNSNGFFASIAYRADLQAQSVDLSPFIRYDINRIKMKANDILTSSETNTDN
jgi:hypothetical protein